MTNEEINRRIAEEVMGEKIKLLRGGFALVDKDDLPDLLQFNWTTDDRGYVIRWFRKDGKRCGERIHRRIMKAKAGQHIDHINHDKKDNRKCNLRFCTQLENNRNKRHLGKNKFKGITRHKGKWKSQIRFQDKNIHIGIFETEIDAAIAYDLKALELHGEFACTNGLVSGGNNG